MKCQKLPKQIKFFSNPNNYPKIDSLVQTKVEKPGKKLEKKTKKSGFKKNIFQTEISVKLIMFSIFYLES